MQLRVLNGDDAMLKNQLEEQRCISVEKWPLKYTATKSRIFGRRKLYGIRDCYATIHEDQIESAQCVQCSGKLIFGLKK